MQNKVNNCRGRVFETEDEIEPRASQEGCL